jgi:hypothetical protein
MFVVVCHLHRSLIFMGKARRLPLESYPVWGSKNNLVYLNVSHLYLSLIFGQSKEPTLRVLYSVRSPLSGRLQGAYTIKLYAVAINFVV